MALKGIKVRLYLNKQQIKLLNNHFNCCRYIYNSALEYKKIMYSDYKINVSKFDIINQLPEIKEEFEFLKEIKAECLQNEISNLDRAYKNFFNKRANFPKFKSKRAKQSFTQEQNFNIKNNKIKFLKQLIKFKCSNKNLKELNNLKIKKIIYSKNYLNQYFASILVEFEPLKLKSLDASKNTVGIDLGINHFLVTSNEEYIENPRFLKSDIKKLKKEQKKLSKKQKGSNNRNKQKIKLAKLYQKIKNQRSYFLNQVSNKLINDNQVIKHEDLKVKNMLKNHYLAQSISDASWSEFLRQLDYKANWYGRKIIKIDTFYPSSKTCNNCGFINKNLKLNNRIFECPICGHKECRDLNAAKNILKFNTEELPEINASGQKINRSLVERRKIEINL